MEPQRNQVYRIGRDPGSHIFLREAPEALPNHASLTLESQGDLVLRDNATVNGTYVNGVRIRKKVLKKTDVLRFGSRNAREFYVKHWIIFDNNVPVGLRKQEDYSVEFNNLKSVYEAYHTEKRKLERNGGGKSYAAKALHAVPFVGPLLEHVARDVFINREQARQKLLMLLNGLEQQYRCPKCDVFLKDIKWEMLLNQGHCHRCKAVWRPSNTNA